MKANIRLKKKNTIEACKHSKKTHSRNNQHLILNILKSFLKKSEFGYKNQAQFLFYSY
jgi:hypothetical protein